MKHFACCFFFLMVCTLSANIFAQKNTWVALFNGKDLNGWDTYIGPPLDDAGKKLSDIPVGLNNDPKHVFTVVEQDGEKVIRISGENWGGISTKQEYADFHLQLLFKWGTLKWGQKKKKKRDSGLLYFSVGDNGADYGAWMRSQEFQIEEGNCGDYWGVAGGMQDIPVIKNQTANMFITLQVSYILLVQPVKLGVIVLNKVMRRMLQENGIHLTCIAMVIQVCM